MRPKLLFFLPAFVAVGLAAGADWPRFRGPDGTGVSPETGLLREWPANGPEVAWSVNLHRGYSSASVMDGAVYVADRDGREEETILCLDLKDGKELWRYTYRERGWLGGFDGSRHAPVVDSNLVFTVGPLGQITALNRLTGALAWNRHLFRDFTPSYIRRGKPKWGYSQAPVIYRDTVIVAPFTTGIGVVALDKSTGQTRWQSPNVGINPFSFVSPEFAVLGGVDQILTIANRHGSNSPPATISSVDAATGSLLWQTSTTHPCNVPIPQPVQISSNRVLYTGGYRIGAFVLEVRQTGAVWHADQILSNYSNCTSHIQTPIVFKDHIYAQSYDEFHNKTNNGLVCLNLDLTLCWRSSDSDLIFDSGPFIIADGMIFVLRGQTGELFLIDTDPAKFHILSRAKVLNAESGRAWAPLAFSNGRIFVRDQLTLKCLIAANGAGARTSGGAQ